MDPLQALDILDQSTPLIPTTLPQHRLIRQALDTLREALTPEPVDNGKTPTKRTTRQPS